MTDYLKLTTYFAERQRSENRFLADALLDAGCDNEEILNHCRAQTPHARGCWLIDLLTARAESSRL